MISLYIDKVKLLFLRDKKLYCQLRDILGFYPHNIQYYKLALRHKSLDYQESGKKNGEGKKNLYHRNILNNERMEYLGDAILGAIVADILYKTYGTKREGFLTNLRSKIVCRNSLNHLAEEIGLSKLIRHAGSVYKSHNNYVKGNAFEAFCGAIYLDRGYKYCYRFIEREIFGKYIRLERLEDKTTNYKSLLIEWCQKRQFQIQFTYNETREESEPVFQCQVLIEGIECGFGSGYKKKSSDQDACKDAWHSLNQDPSLKLRIAQIAKEKRLITDLQSRRDKALSLIRGRHTVVFDLDGTLLDTLQDLQQSTNFALRTCGYPERTIDEVRNFVGNGVKLLIQRAMPEEITSKVDEEANRAFEECFAVFKQHYIEHCQDSTRLYPGIEELLSTLRAAGYHLAIVSNKLQDGVTELYEKWFKNTVEIAIGENPGVQRKPAPDMVNKALAEMGVDKEDAIYVGDSDVDLKTAENSEVPCISVSWGFRSADFLIQHGASIIVSNPSEILDILSASDSQV